MSQPLARSTADANFDAIAHAVMETARGRWFLAEYAWRNRNADTRLILEMLARIERAYARKNGIPEVDRLRGDLIELAEAIARSKADMAGAGTEASAAEIEREAPPALETVVVTSERTTGDILNATERIQEVAWMLRERGLAASVCNELDALTAEIYSVCAAQDLSHRRIVLLVDLLRLAEGRIETMLAAKRREGAEVHALVDALDDGHLRPADIPTPRVPDLKPYLAALAPASEPEPMPTPEPLAPVAMAEVATVEAPAPVAEAPAPLVDTAAAPEPVEETVPEPAAAPARAASWKPPRPDFERLSAVERMALFS
jgi:chemotaxis protein CheZ